MLKEITPGLSIRISEIKALEKIDIDIEIENKLFYKARTTFDFSGSKNIRINQNSNSLHQEATILPKETKKVISLILEGNWNISLNVKHQLEIPDKKLVRKLLRKEFLSLQKIIQQCKMETPSDIDFYNEPIEDCLQELTVLDLNFVDFDFPPIDASVSNIDEEIEEFPYVIHWRSPPDYLKCQPVIFYDTIHPQNLEVFYPLFPRFISVIYCLCEYPHYIERLFDVVTYNDKIYRCKLCLNGKWENVTIDSFFPHRPEGGPLFLHGKGNEIWFQILEKAYAKSLGSYFNICDPGFSDILFNLTGTPMEIVQLTNRLEADWMTQVWNMIEKALVKGEMVVLCNIFDDHEIQKEELLMNYCFCLVEISEHKGTRILHIRDPLETRIYKKNWMQSASMFTDESYFNSKAGEPDNIDCLFIPFIESARLFDSVIITKFANWEEARLSSQFMLLKDFNDDQFNLTISKWYYHIEIEYKSELFIYVHQKPFYYDFVLDYKPILTVCLVIYRIEKSGEFTYVDSTNFSKSHRHCFNQEFPQGKYAIAVVTPTCKLLKNPDLIGKVEEIFDSPGVLSKKMLDTLHEIFERYDLNLDSYLDYFEFNCLLEAIELGMSESQFNLKILNRYGMKNKGIDFKGFKRFIFDLYKEAGEEIFRIYLKRLGYDKSLFCKTSRNFIISFHSREKIKIIRRDSVTEGIFLKGLLTICDTNGETVDSRFPKYGGVSLIEYQSPTESARIHICQNNTSKMVQMEFDISGMKNANVSHPCRHIVIPPGETKLVSVVEQDFFAEDDIIYLEDWEMDMIHKKDFKTVAKSVYYFVSSRQEKKKNKLRFPF